MSIVKVAQLAGVSHATVSRMINGTGKVHELTAERILGAMKKLGYVPPPPERRRGRTARRGSRVQPQYFVVLCLDHEVAEHGSFLLSLFEGVRKAAAREGISASLMFAEKNGQLPALISRKQVDGLLLVGGQPDPEVMPSVRQIPYLWLTSHEGAGESTVLVGNEPVGRMAAQYLIERGHRRVAFLCAMQENPSYRLRGETFGMTATSAGLVVASYVGRSKDSSTTNLREGLRGLVERMLGKKTQPTGIFCPSDRMTALAYSILLEKGARPGRDVEFVSCDHEEAFLTGLFPRPATIDLGCEARGKAAVEQLLVRLRNPESERATHLHIEPILISGEQ